MSTGDSSLEVMGLHKGITSQLCVTSNVRKGQMRTPCAGKGCSLPRREAALLLGEGRWVLQARPEGFSSLFATFLLEMLKWLPQGSGQSSRALV